jgi:predicted amidohydrolase
MEKFIASCIQTNSRDRVEENIAVIGEFVKQAASDGARLVALPENAFLMAVGRRFHEQVYEEAQHPALQACAAWAKHHAIWLLIGSLHIKRKQRQDGEAPYVNRSYLLSPEGNISAHYDKIHLFDVTIPGGESHQESRRFASGDRAVLAKTSLCHIGMTICYDVRFPQLYRKLSHAGAQLLTIPAAFTRFTGEKGGWHILTRARAMESGAFVLAPAQCAEHAGGRKTYGHSMIIGPWGDILAEAKDQPTVITAEIDLAQVVETRQVMPSLQHDRSFTLEEQ